MGIQKSGLVCFALVCAVACSATGKSAIADERVSLFDGKSLTGWRVTKENPESFRVEDGMIVAAGPRAHLFYDGPAGTEFTNFELTMQVKTLPGSNSGVFFHTHYQEEDWPAKGLEAQINSTQGDPRKTGSIYAIADLRVYNDGEARPKLGYDFNVFSTEATAPHRDEEWFSYVVRVEGDSVTTLVNGTPLVAWTQPSSWPDKNRRLSSGTFALQAHDPESVVYFKEIYVEPLAAELEEVEVEKARDATENGKGALLRIGSFPSQHVAEREVLIWLPPGYNETLERYPVLYMHDGQNVFEPNRSWTGDEWRVDETLSDMIADRKIDGLIVVASANTGETRWNEYAPEKVIEEWRSSRLAEIKESQGVYFFGEDTRSPEEIPLLADEYLKFIVQELKPYVDETYRTKSDQQNTMIAGSSMGGLISLYALSEYPDVFGSAASLSMHWPIGRPQSETAQSTIPYFQDYLSEGGFDPDVHRIWIDRGTQALDQYYEPYFNQMKAWFEREYPGYDDSIVFKVYPGTDHSEAAWANRFEEVASFLVSK